MQQKESPRDRIVTAARRLFSSQGFHLTPVSELAVAADVSVGQIYRLFKDKNDVILAIVSDDSDRRMGEADGIVRSVNNGSMTIREAFVDLATRSLSNTEQSLSFEILAEASRNIVVAEKIIEMCGRFRSVFRQLAILANPALSEEKLDGAEEVLFGLIFGLGHRGMSCPRLSIKETADQTAGIIMAALTGFAENDERQLRSGELVQESDTPARSRRR